jgi:hypothetical protein
VSIKQISDTVRINYKGSPFDVAHDVKVEQLVNGVWATTIGFNSLSDDYAYTSANEAAQRIVSKSN